MQNASLLPFRLAVVDIDDTLLGCDKQISAANAIAVRTLQEQGVRVILASGRRHENMLRFHEQLGLTGLIVSSGGALVKDAETGNILHQCLVAADLAAELAIEGTARGMTLIYYRLDGVYVREKSGWTDLYQRRSGDELKVYGDLTRLAGDTPQKVIWCEQPEQIAQLLPHMKSYYDGRLEVITTEPEYIEFTALGVDKALGVAAVAKHYGIEPAQVVTFGDGNNDVPMLKWAGLGVAMSNARPNAKAVADLVAPPGDPETSLARAIALVLSNSKFTQDKFKTNGTNLRGL